MSSAAVAPPITNAEKGVLIASVCILLFGYYSIMKAEARGQ